MSIPEHENPLDLFAEWYDKVGRSGLAEPTAVALATVDGEGRPSLRMVLLKGFDSQGFVFYTNLESRKARDLAANPNAALCFHWMTLKRQVRIEGPAEQVPDGEADAYFASRGRDSQIGAWASKQSQPLEGRFELERRVAAHALKFGVGRIARPAFWSGFRVVPRRIEFWQHGLARLHDRLVYERADDGWDTQRLYP